MGYEDDDNFDWVIQKKKLIEQRAAKEAEDNRIKNMQSSNNLDKHEKKKKHGNKQDAL